MPKKKDVKELIIQKKQSYQDIIDNTKVKDTNKALLTGISAAACIVGVGGIIAPVSAIATAGYVLGAAVGGYGLFKNGQEYMKNFVLKIKSRIAMRKYNKALKVIDSVEKEEAEKTKTK